MIEDSDIYTANDWTTFRKTFGLAVYEGGSIATVHPGGCPDPGINGDDFEAILDAESATSSAPSAEIQVATCANTATVFGWPYRHAKPPESTPGPTDHQQQLRTLRGPERAVIECSLQDGLSAGGS